MCGIFGWSFKESFFNKNYDKIRFMGYLLCRLNDKRGGHSWGWYDLENINRDLGDITEDFLKLEIKSTILAHTRYASTGAKTIENAHPFEIGDIIGAHNGMVYNHLEMNQKYPARDCSVDSQHIFWHISEQLNLSELEGYGAIWFTKKDDNRIYLGKFNSGVLAIAKVMDKKENQIGTVFSSDKDHLSHALQISGFNFIEYQVNNKNLYYIKNNILYITKEQLDISKRTSFVSTVKNYYDYANDYPDPFYVNDSSEYTINTTESELFSDKELQIIKDYEEGRIPYSEELAEMWMDREIELELLEEKKKEEDSYIDWQHGNMYSWDKRGKLIKY